MGSIFNEPETDVNGSSVRQIVKAIERGHLPRFEKCINSIVTATVARAKEGVISLWAGSSGCKTHDRCVGYFISEPTARVWSLVCLFSIIAQWILWMCGVSVTFAEKDETLYSSVASEEDGSSNNKNNSATDASQGQNPYGNDKAVNNVATISPGNTLEFCVTSPNVQATDVISIKSNLTNKNVAFKVKTTTLGRYKVRPAIGIVKPYETTDVIITLEDKVEDPAQIAKDKFLIICQEVDSEVMLSQVSDLIRAVPKDLQTEHRLKVMMSKADSFNTLRKAEISSTTIPVSSRNSTNAVGGKQLDDIQQKLERICTHNAQLESRLSTFGIIMFAQCCMLLVLTFVIISDYWSPDLHGHQSPGSCKPWSLEG